MAKQTNSVATKGNTNVATQNHNQSVSTLEEQKLIDMVEELEELEEGPELTSEPFKFITGDLYLTRF